MVRTATMTTRSKALWGVSLLLWLLAGTIGVSAFTMNMGAVMHDIYCQDH